MSDVMDLKTFLSRREERDLGGSFRHVCLNCFRPQKNCLCGDIQPFNTETHIVILMHPKEAKKVRLGTGRLTRLFLSNSELIIGADLTHDKRVNSLVNDERYFPVILYPGENSIEVSRNESFFENIEDRSLLVFVIDASWPLARKILRLSQNLHSLPQIHFRPQETSRYLIKKQPHPHCLCTIESVGVLLKELENMGLEKCRGKHRLLGDALEKMCRMQSKYESDATVSGYRKEKSLRAGEDRPPGKRQRRSVCFDKRDGMT